MSRFLLKPPGAPATIGGRAAPAPRADRREAARCPPERTSCATPLRWSPGSALLTAGLAAVPGTAAAKGTVPDPLRATAPGVYVVTLAAPPAASYAATRPTGGARFDRTRPAVTAYTDRLGAEQDRVVHALGDPAVLYRYTTALNGFAATLTSDQVRAGPGHPGRHARRAQHQAARRPGADQRRSRAGRRQQLARPPRPRRAGRRLGAARRPAARRARGRGRRRGHRHLAGQPQLQRPAAAHPRHRTPAPRLPRRLRRGRGVGARGLQRQGRLRPLVRQRVRRGERRRRGVPLPPRRHRSRLARRVDGRG